MAKKRVVSSKLGSDFRSERVQNSNAPTFEEVRETYRENQRANAWPWWVGPAIGVGTAVVIAGVVAAVEGAS